MIIAEDRRFSLSSTTKRFLKDQRTSTSTLTRQHPRGAGTGCTEEGYVANSYKEMFHFTSTSSACQTPDYWHIPTAVGDYYRKMKTQACILFQGINRHVLKHVRREYYEQDAFPTNNEYHSWVNACESSDQHLLTSFRYDESNPDNLHAAAHVDRGLFTILTNPNDMQVRVEGNWIDLGPQPPGTFAVLCGFTLEKATNGLFQAALHRVRNSGTGERRSRAFKVRLNPSLVIRPDSITACISSDLVDSIRLLGEERTFVDVMIVQDLMDRFDRIYSSINAPSNANYIRNSEETQLPSLNESSGNFSPLQPILIYQVLDWLRDLHDLARLAQTCNSFKVVAGHESLCVPAAENNHDVDWGVALDRIDCKSTSHARLSDDDAPDLSVDRVLTMASYRWLSLLGKEMKSKLVRESNTVTIILRDFIGEKVSSTSLKLRFNTRMSRVCAYYAHVTGVAAASVRLLLDGEKVQTDQTFLCLKLEIDSVIDVMLEQTGD